MAIGVAFGLMGAFFMAGMYVSAAFGGSILSHDVLLLRRSALEHHGEQSVGIEY
ncbi:MAG: hypothetical protein Ct9H300mP11_21630 [Chloroflexota bacterium]|nr:MAG: hypothetical protein Ct9H300mP11_21630 [Chloroflexota bacterium]